MKRRELIKGAILSLLSLPFVDKIANAFTVDKNKTQTNLFNPTRGSLYRDVSGKAVFYFDEKLDKSDFSNMMREVFKEHQFAPHSNFLIGLESKEARKELLTLISTINLNTNIKVSEKYFPNKLPLLIDCIKNDLLSIKQRLHNDFIEQNKKTLGDNFSTYIFPYFISIIDSEYHIRFGQICLWNEDYIGVHIFNGDLNNKYV